MPIKPIAAGTPQRIISKINEIVNAVNTGGSGGSGTADAILDAATIADAGKALGIDAEGDPALIDVGVELLLCTLTYTGSGSAEDPYVGHINNAAKLLDALDSATPYNPIIGLSYNLEGDAKAFPPAIVLHNTVEYDGTTFFQSSLTFFGDVSTVNLSTALQINIGKMGDTVFKGILDNIVSITAQTWTVADDVLTYRENSQ